MLQLIAGCGGPLSLNEIKHNNGKNDYLIYLSMNYFGTPATLTHEKWRRYSAFQPCRTET